jgi:hypothetical protein
MEITRRTMLAGAAAATSFTRTALADWAPNPLHLLEPTHNERFMALMDRLMPKWRSHRDVLNRLPVRHESWDY